MGVTRVHLSEPAQCLGQIHRLVNNHILHGSESLCKLLRYLAMHALTHPGVPLKEYEIATQVFHRPADFDPQLDSTIRVQAGRLRLKLTEYYGSEGADDPILVDLPKGGYLLTFHHRTAAPHRVLSLTPMRAKEDSWGSLTRTHNWAIVAIVLVILLAATESVIVTKLATRTSPETVAANHEPIPAAFRTFWSSFISGPEEPWVIFSNGAFVGRH